MTIHIESLEILAIIGILDFERVTPQQINIDVEIEYFYKSTLFINYANVITLIEKMIEEKKYKLLEDALIDIQTQIINQYPQVIKLNLKITKPNIIKNAQVALSLKYLSDD
jgi:dihydroneopterin aldolase